MALVSVLARIALFQMREVGEVERRGRCWGRKRGIEGNTKGRITKKKKKRKKEKRRKMKRRKKNSQKQTNIATPFHSSWLLISTPPISSTTSHCSWTNPSYLKSGLSEKREIRKKGEEKGKRGGFFSLQKKEKNEQTLQIEVTLVDKLSKVTLHQLVVSGRGRVVELVAIGGN